LPSPSVFVATSGQLNYPSGLTWGADGKLYVVDLGALTAQGQVLRYNADGSFDTVFASSNLLAQFPSDAIFTTHAPLLTANLGLNCPVAFGGPGTSGSIYQFDATTGAFVSNLTANSFPVMSTPPAPAQGVTNVSPSQLMTDIGNVAPVASAGGPY